MWTDQLVHICQSYRKNKSGSFLWPTVYYTTIKFCENTTGIKALKTQCLPVRLPLLSHLSESCWSCCTLQRCRPKSVDVQSAVLNSDKIRTCAKTFLCMSKSEAERKISIHNAFTNCSKPVIRSRSMVEDEEQRLVRFVCVSQPSISQ